jgi:putative CocE/NonD family hydrolase
VRHVAFAALLVPTLLLGAPINQAPLRDAHPEDDFTLREEMVPMRDGVKLYTIVLMPKRAPGPMPILLERTPYDASRRFSTSTTRLSVALGERALDGGYIFVFQDLRGRFRSDGEYAMYRVPRGAYNSSSTDETTDAWDTIDWLVKHVANNSGKVGVWGTSYPGWLTLAAMRDPHPALAAAVPFNPVVDVWKADDWFHWGAFRFAYAFDYIYAMESRKGQNVSYPYGARDLYAWLLPQGSAVQALGGRLDSRHEMWPRLVENASYTQYWRDCAADRWFDHPSRAVPALTVHGLWDQEDIYGAPAAYAALERLDPSNDHNFFAAGPWYHGQHFADGVHLGALSFDEDTARRFREDVLTPFLAHFLKGTPAAALSPVTVFETGSNRWRTFDRWPPAGTTRRLYLQPNGRLAYEPPASAESFTEYVSDPARPVPNAPLPHWGFDYENPVSIGAWRRWLVEDQRFVDHRPDVATWSGPPLDAPLTVRGPVTVHLVAETTGTDADWVVKLIDVYPDDDVPMYAMSGYELMVSGDIFRGRYRENLEGAHPIAANRPLVYTWPLPHVNHTFRAGHRLMVQVQSTWFPLYDRNPQSFVPSIMTAPAAAYAVARQRIHHGGENATYLELNVDVGDRTAINVVHRSLLTVYRSGSHVRSDAALPSDGVNVSGTR